MAVVQSTYNERIKHGVPGMIKTQVLWDGVTRSLESASAGFGLAISQGAGDKGCVLGGSLAGFLGFSIKDVTLPVGRNRTVDKFIINENVGILTRGEMWVQAAADVVLANNPGVYFDPVTGAISSTPGARSATRTPDAGNTGNGVMTINATPADPTALPGQYRVVMIEPGANAGTFAVFGPNGQEVGQGTVGVAYANGPRFTIADGATDFIAGDSWTVLVGSASIGPIPNARWTNSCLQGDVAGVALK